MWESQEITKVRILPSKNSKEKNDGQTTISNAERGQPKEVTVPDGPGK